MERNRLHLRSPYVDQRYNSLNSVVRIPKTIHLARLCPNRRRAEPLGRGEVNAAMEREDREKRTILFPICIDDTVMHAPQPWAADIRRTRQIGDFSKWKNHDWYQEASNGSCGT